ncbi:hypothetical protein LCGC14_1536960 [marine sediment metagenome]|uniref:Uncharacterized protein n=1 Tax=marine sediment metagenome TaxID=412755 RepID=A0A0F9LA13_9ZZZZ
MTFFLIYIGAYLLLGLLVFIDLEIRARPHRHKPLSLVDRLVKVPVLILLWPMILIHPITRRWPK